MNPFNNVNFINNNSINNININSIQSNQSNPLISTIVETRMEFLNSTDQINISLTVQQGTTLQIGSQEKDRQKRIKLKEGGDPTNSKENGHKTNLQSFNSRANGLSTCSEVILRRGIFSFLRPEDFRTLSSLDKKFYKLADLGIIDWLNFGNQLSATDWLTDGNQLCSLCPLSYRGYRPLHDDDNLPELTPFFDFLTSFLNRKNNKRKISQLDLNVDDRKYSPAFIEAYRIHQIIKLFPNLKSLAVDLRETEKREDYGLIDANLNDLQTLQLQHCSQAFLEQVLQVHRFDSLKILILDYFDPPTLQVLADSSGSFTQLQEFYCISDMAEETARGLSVIAQLPTMNTIMITFNDSQEHTISFMEWFSLFGASITTVTQLKSLDFSYSDPNVILGNGWMSDENASILVETLTERMPSLRILKGCILSNFGLKELASRMYEKGSLLEVLGFDYELCPVSAKDLASFALLPNLTKLDLSNMENPKLIESFFNRLRGPVRFHELNLSNCSATDSVIKALNNQVTKICSVKELNLSSDSHFQGLITEAGMKNLISVEDALALTKLDLSYNQISREGLEVLLANLQDPFVSNNSSTTSSSSSCSDPNRAVRSRRLFSSLQCLNLSGNIFSFCCGQRGMEVLAAVTNGIPSLKQLYLSHIGMQDEGVEFFVAKINTLSLRVLSLSCNGFSSKGAEAIIHSAKKFSVIEELDLSSQIGVGSDEFSVSDSTASTSYKEAIRLIFEKYYEKFDEMRTHLIKYGKTPTDTEKEAIANFMDLYKAVKKGSRW